MLATCDTKPEVLNASLGVLALKLAQLFGCDRRFFPDRSLVLCLSFCSHSSCRLRSAGCSGLLSISSRRGCTRWPRIDCYCTDVAADLSLAPTFRVFTWRTALVCLPLQPPVAAAEVAPAGRESTATGVPVELSFVPTLCVVFVRRAALVCIIVLVPVTDGATTADSELVASSVLNKVFFLVLGCRAVCDS